MTDHEHAEDSKQRLRIYVTGSCDGLAEVLQALEAHDELELVGSADIIQEAAAALAGGHLDAILHATRGPQYPAEELATVREYTRAPVIVLASGDCSGAARGGARGRRRRPRPAAAADGEHRLRHSQGVPPGPQAAESWTVVAVA